MVIAVIILFSGNSTQDHLIDFTHNLRRQALTEVHHGGWIKGQMFVIIAGVSAKVLQIRIILNLQCRLFI